MTDIDKYWGNLLFSESWFDWDIFSDVTYRRADKHKCELFELAIRN